MKYLKRIIVLPFAFGFIIIHLIFIVAYTAFDYLKYGGEFDIYNHQMNKTTLQDIFYELQKKNNK